MHHPRQGPQPVAVRLSVFARHRKIPDRGACDPHVAEREHVPGRQRQSQAKKRTVQIERLLSVGNPRFDVATFRDLKDLPWAATQASEIAAFYRKLGGLLERERQGVETSEGRFRRSDVAHFATHYIADERSPMLSVLPLAGERESAAKENDGVLQTFEFYNMNLSRLRLVVLSACQTGIERYYKGEGAIGLARPFQMAGIPLVVASLWPVESYPTKELMIAFHKHRKSGGLSTAQALRQAQIDMLKSGSTRVPQSVQLGGIHRDRRPRQFLSISENSISYFFVFSSIGGQGNACAARSPRHVPLHRAIGLLLRQTAQTSATIGVHSITDDHELRFRFVKKGPGPGMESEETLTIGHAMIRRSSDLWLDVEGEPSTEQQAAEPFIAGSRNDPPTDPQDFRRVMDLEGEHFYNRPLKVRRGVLRPILFVAKGLFYTATLTSDLYRTIPVAANGAARTTRRAVIWDRSPNTSAPTIYLTHSNQALVLRAGRNGSELFRLNREEGTTYEITIENGDTPRAPAGSDFRHYYDAVELNPGEPKILIDVCGLPPMRGGLGSPCEVIWFSKSAGGLKWRHQ